MSLIHPKLVSISLTCSPGEGGGGGEWRAGEKETQKIKDRREKRKTGERKKRKKYRKEGQSKKDRKKGKTEEKVRKKEIVRADRFFKSRKKKRQTEI